MAAATFFLYFVFFIHSYSTLIHIHAFAEASLRFFHCFFVQKEKPPWGAERGFELGPNWATLHPTEPRCTYWATLHTYWARLHTDWATLHLLSHAAHWLSHAAPTEPRCSLLSHAAPLILIRHITFSVGNLHSLCIDTYVCIQSGDFNMSSEGSVQVYKYMSC